MTTKAKKNPFATVLQKLNVSKNLQSGLTLPYNLGAFGVFAAGFVFVLQYGDKVEDRHERFWRVLREAIAWREVHPDSGGNVVRNTRWNLSRHIAASFIIICLAIFSAIVSS
jgi:hypothetical protein